MNDTRIELAPTEYSARYACQHVATWLDSIGCGAETVTDAELVLNELVDNAYRHAQTTIIVVALLHDDRLRLEVHDANGAPPVAGTPGVSGGFGLMIVEALVDVWDWQATAYGKRVWTEQLC